jgi:hypothetical protein
VTTDADEGVMEKVQEKAAERVTLSVGELWLLRIAAATGIMSALSHGLEFLHDIGVL